MVVHGTQASLKEFAMVPSACRSLILKNVHLKHQQAHIL